MAELAVIMSMITVTTTAANILGIIKRRCSASQEITELIRKCAELVDKIHKLLKTLEEDAKSPRITRRISVALTLRRDEFDAVLKNLVKLNWRTKRTHPIDRTVKFIASQGWANKMQAIHSDLVQLRNGIENIASNWDVAELVVTKFNEIVTIDATKRKESQRGFRITESETMGSGATNFMDRILTTIVKLSDANKSALNRYGNLTKLSLPDALYEASSCVRFTDRECCLQLLQRSAELLHPQSNWRLGLEYKYGGMVEKNLDLAVSYFRVAGSHACFRSILHLLAHYVSEKDAQNVSKYIERASSVGLQWADQIRCNRYPMGHSFESGELDQLLIGTSQSLCALQQSVSHFFGDGAPISDQEAVDALPAFDSSSYSVHFGAEGSNFFYIRPDHYRWDEEVFPGRMYLHFLFESKQFLPVLILAYGSVIYSPRQTKRYALHAAKSNCVDAHVFLANHYTQDGHQDNHKMKRHLRIAADAGLSQAQTICRRMFGRTATVSKRMRTVEERRDSNEDIEKHRQCAKQSERTTKIRSNRKGRASKKYALATK